MNPFDSPSQGNHSQGNHSQGNPNQGDQIHGNTTEHDALHDDMRFDRLVDGELSDAERRRVLAALDDEPGGWRRCAMAFLEAQAWRQGMLVIHQRGATADAWHGAVESQPLMSTKHTPHPDSLDNGRDGAASARPGVLGLVLAMAGCFLVAFVLGSEFRQRLSTDPLPPAPLAHQSIPDTAELPVVSTPREIEDAAPPSQVIPWGEATFVMDDEGSEVEVPVFDLDAESRQVLLENSMAAFDNLRRQLQRRGFDVRQNVHWSPVEIGGDRKMLVPLGDFEISPISSRAIQ